MADLDDITEIKNRDQFLQALAEFGENLREQIELECAAFDIDPEASRHQSGYHVAGAPYLGLCAFQELWLGGSMDSDGYRTHIQGNPLPYPPLQRFMDEEFSCRLGLVFCLQC